jgi:hypothetical protein
MMTFKQYLESNGISGSLVRGKHEPNHRKINATVKQNFGIAKQYKPTGHHKSEHPIIQSLQNNHGPKAVPLSPGHIAELKQIYNPRLAKLTPGKPVTINSNSGIEIEIFANGHGRAYKRV